MKVLDREERTPTVMGSLNPVFTSDNIFTFPGGAGSVVELTCLDWDPASYDDVLVKVIIILPCILPLVLLPPKRKYGRILSYRQNASIKN